LDRIGLIDYSKLGLLFVLLGSVFLTNFISTKNGLSKDSSYSFFLLFIPHPSVLDNINLVFNLFILLALVDYFPFSPKSFKEKNSMLHCGSLAALFHFGLFFICTSVYFDNCSTLLEIIELDITIYCLFCSRNSFALSSILLTSAHWNISTVV
jgi:hypothetical protein